MNGFLVAGIGASAGGIQALQAFFEATPPDSGIAYVVILHLSPDHDSQLAQVLQHSTSMPVSQVTTRTRLEQNHIYVIPPDRHLEMEPNHIVVSPNLDIADRRAPVDIFFRSLADSHEGRSVGVVLSGTGANGSMGLKRIKERGGAVFVQNPREAQFNEMPRNAISTNLVDEVLSVLDIPAKIIAYRDSLGSVHIAEEPQDRGESEQQALRTVLTELRLRTGHDFANYKRPTLLRRIERRIHVRDLRDLPAYASFLQKHPEEVHSLLKDLLISVTNFFRDKKPFDELESTLLPLLMAGKTGQDNLRIWVAGCATGEEAYSIAMICADLTLGMVDVPKVQIFATDIDDTAIATAREGFYTLNDAADVSAERLSRYFTREGDGFRVRRELREMILFANHNFLKDSPFSRIDLVSCRNVLIYLNRAAQERVFETFHFALRTGGFLLLGSSESVEGAKELFGVYNREYHIWQSRQALTRSIIVPESIPRIDLPQLPPKVAAQPRSQDRISFGELHQQLVELYAPPSLIINEEQDIVHVSENAGRYLKFGGGEPTQNLLHVVREELRAELRSAVYQAAQRQVAVSALGLKTRIEEKTETINIHVRPVPPGHSNVNQGYLLVIFEPGSETSADVPYIVTNDEPASRHLEAEVARLKAQLRASNEQHEFGAEELKAGNEELQAMNEELRSATEELETSKEELQSINEELSTVNQELKVKVEESSLMSNNLRNIINSTDIGTIILDRSFRVVLFTPAARKIFNLIPADQTRPLSDITNKLRDGSLVTSAETVLQSLHGMEKEMETLDGQTYLTRLTPYRTDEDRIQGVVISFVDITHRKKTESALRAAEEWRKLIIQSAEDYAIFSLGLDRQVNSWNVGAQNVFGYTDDEIIGKTSDILFVPEDREKGEPEAEAERALSTGRAENERWHIRKDGSRFWGSGLVHPLREDDGKLIGFVKIMRDLTEARHAQEALAQSEEKYRTLFDSIDEGFTIVEVLFDDDGKANDYRFLELNKAHAKMSGLPRSVVGKRLREVMPSVEDALLERVGQVALTGEPIRYEQYVSALDRWFDVYAARVGGNDSRIVANVFNDITARKHHEANLLFLAQISAEFAPLATVPEIMKRVAGRLAQHLHLSRCHFSIIDEDLDRIEVIHDWRRDERMPSLMGVNKLSENLTKTARKHYSAGKIFVMNGSGDADMFGKPIEEMHKLGFHSLVQVPYRQNGRWKFLVTVARPDASNWSDDELELIRELTARIYIRIERARAEDELREAHASISQILESVSDVFYALDKDYRFTYINKNGEDSWGVKREDVLGKNLFEVFPTAKGSESERMQVQVMRSRQAVHYEAVSPVLNRWISVGISPSSDGGISVFFHDIEDRKLAEQSLQASETRARTLADAIPHVLWANDAAGETIYFNKRWFEYTALAEEESRGRGWQVIIHPDDAETARTAWQQALSLGEVFDAELRMRRYDGEYRWFICRNVPLLNEKGEIVSWFGSATDIHDLKQAQELLMDSKERLRITVESATDYAIITTSPDGIIEGWSRGAEQMYGYTEEEAMGQNAKLLSGAEEPEADAHENEMFAAQHQGFAIDESWHRRKDGTRFFMSGVIRPIYDGQLRGFVKVARDLTEKQLAENALHISEERYRIALSSAEMAAWDWDVVNDRVVWNDQHYYLLGLQPDGEQKTTSYFMTFVAEDDARAVETALRSTVAENQYYQTEFRIMRADNQEVRWMSGYGRAVTRNPEGRATRIVGVMYDITARKRVEEQKDEFIGIASHELRTPVTSIKAYAGILQEIFEESGDAQSVELMQKLDVQVDRLTRLIYALLDTTRISEGKLELNKVDFKIDDLIVDTTENMQRIASGHKITLNLNANSVVYADQERIRQVLINLVGNAVKYSPGKDQIIIESKTDGLTVQISIQDFGIGIDDVTKNQVFGRFFRGANPDIPSGLGLGLFISAMIIRHHGGHISLTSKKGEGATFTITIPVHTDQKPIAVLGT